jgi:hypothetical protein
MLRVKTILFLVEGIHHANELEAPSSIVKVIPDPTDLILEGLKMTLLFPPDSISTNCLYTFASVTSIRNPFKGLGKLRKVVICARQYLLQIFDIGVWYRTQYSVPLPFFGGFACVIGCQIN